MKKQDLILAKKALAARQVKTEHKVPTIIQRIYWLNWRNYVSFILQYIQSIMKQRGLNQSQSASSLKNSSEPNLSKSADWGDTRASTASGQMGRSFSSSTFQLPDINTNTSMSSPKGSKNNSTRSVSIFYVIVLEQAIWNCFQMFLIAGAYWKRAERSKLANGERTCTACNYVSNNMRWRCSILRGNYYSLLHFLFPTHSARTARRKMQSTVSKTINLRATNTLNHTVQPEHDYTATGMEIPNVEITDNFFMPKKQIQRSDGATLSDIYNSKKADSWGKILKAQIAEEVRIMLIYLLVLWS